MTNPISFERLTHEQQASVVTGHPQVLCVASPGSGKTRSLVERIRYLLRAGTNPARIVAITFTNVGASEIRDRLAQGEEPVDGLNYIGTLHGYCLRLLEKYGDALGFRPGVSVIDEERAESLTADAVKLLGVKVTKDELAAARARWQRSGGLGEQQGKADLAVAHYYLTLRRANATDYDGLLAYALNLLRKNKGKPDQLPRIEHLLVDEYQDSTELDALIYAALAALNSWLVGDPDQAIFSFRGGQMANIMGLADDPAWEKHFFTANFRSDDAICEAANRLIRNNANRVKKRMHTTSLFEGTVERMVCLDDMEEVNAVFWKIADATSGGQRIGHRHEDIAILVRSNELAKLFRDGAKRRGVPVAQAAQADPDKDLPGWKFARATVDMLAAPSSDFHFRHWLTQLKGPEEADHVARQAAILRWSMAGHYFGGGLPSVPTLSELPSRLLSLGVKREVGRALDTILASLSPGATLAEVSLAMRAATASVLPEGAPGGVTISTIHGAKGREWPLVFMPALEVGVLPNSRAAKEDGGLEEERRLCFVGATRAASHLILSHAAKRAEPWGKRAVKEMQPSPFVAELLA